MHEAPFLEFLLIHKDWLTRSYNSTVVEQRLSIKYYEIAKHKQLY